MDTFTSCKYSHHHHRHRDHHNKNKPQKNNFLPKLTPADAGLVSRLTVTRHLKETG